MRVGRDARRRRVAAWAGRALLVWAAIEIALAASRWPLQQQVLVLVDPAPDWRASYEAARDPNLGWPPVTSRVGHARVDASGARYLPAFPSPRAPVCVSLYGDSFAWSSESDEEHAWANVLAERARCRVTSYGVPGQGTDQAYLRYLHATGDGAPVVLLIIFAENLMRNVSRLRELRAPDDLIRFKPRFILEDGALTLVPVPADHEIDDAAKHPERLAHEHFLPDTRAGLPRWRFPHVLSLARLAQSDRVRAIVRGEAPHAAFFDPHHPSGALQVTAAIGEAFHREAARRGVFGGILVIPAGRDFAFRRRKGRFPHHTITDALSARGVPLVDVGEAFAARLPSESPCDLYTHCVRGHLSALGNRWLAESVHAWLEERGEIRSAR